MPAESAFETLRSAWNTMRFVWAHPLASRNRTGALSRWLRWQVGSRILPGRAVVPFVDDTVLLIEPGMTGATGNVYVGLHEFADMAFLLHYLREADQFVDIGANVGTYTVLASGVRGARSIAIEPLPRTYERLRANLRVNALEDRVRALNVGVASKPGILRFTRSLDTVNHVVAGGEGSEAESVAVPVMTLDQLAADHSPLLVKIDVEGFETEVLAGAQAILGRAELRALIIELNGSGVRYGFDEVALQRQIESFGFVPHVYDPFGRCLRRIEGKSHEGNTLYLRDIAFVAQRVCSAPRVRVLGTEL